ncbi:ATP-binding protein [Calothrix sp. FACHB-1219]|uniref:ATP-binding protein n=1 Tax=unclassified Calothrix TaxID=2619626 RepID=UPI0016865EC3|nr:MULTISPECIES: ATP-binding protein [unclassified Calothrix]MBD2208193.1 ATP-binding protein [Calothrix sp. FACHB-168]MBD2220357.1 ATP-binding protein [Calothrix sp. FACHB-1219]
MPTGWKIESAESESTKLKDKKPEKNFSVNASNPETPELARLEMFSPEAPKRNFDDLIVPQIVRERIETALNRILYHDVLYHEWNLKKIDPQGRRVAINMYGPPGTGKTFCAEAIANYLGKKIIKVNYAEIESKYVGETPKNITSAFTKAHETDAVLFFDEADSILGKRLTNVTQSADHGVNVSRSVMLLELDKFDGVVIFATNLASNYDGAFVRRILAHIEFELPDEACLVKLWQYLLPDEVPRSEDTTSEWLAQESQGLAGGDILNVVKLAASQAVTRKGNERLVMQSDIKNAIAQVKNAKEKIGSTGIQQQPTTTIKTCEFDELPSDIQQRVQPFVDNQQANSEDVLESPANNFSKNGNSSSNDTN